MQKRGEEKDSPLAEVPVVLGRAVMPVVLGQAAVQNVQQQACCRICLLKHDTHDNQNQNQNQKDDPLMVPCSCTGNPKYVHASCLAQWRIYQAPLEFAQCGECNFRYHLPSRDGGGNGDTADAAAAIDVGGGGDSSTNTNPNNPNSSISNSTTKKKKNKKKQWKRKTRMACAILVDFVLVTLIVQGLVIGMGYLIWYLDANKDIASTFGESVNCVDSLRRSLSENGTTTTTTSTESSGNETENDYYCNHVGSMYYFIGFLCIILLVGCCFGWTGFFFSVQDSLQQQELDATLAGDCENPLPTRDAHATPAFYQRRQQRNTNTTNSNNNSSCNCNCNCLGDLGRKIQAVVRDLKHDIGVGARTAARGRTTGCCRNSTRSSSNTNNGSASSRPRCCNSHMWGSGASCDAEVMMIFVLVLVLTVILVLALSGFLILMIILVVVVQRIVQRHVHFMHRRRLVKEFPVLDLNPTAANSNNRETLADNLQKNPPKLSYADMHSLRKLGLDLEEMVA